MRIAVISDIHGNCVALDAVLADLRRAGVDQVVCNGDAIQGGAQPAETVSRLRELACPIVMGNADAWLLSGQPTGNEPFTQEQEDVRQWSLGRLSEDDRAFIAAFAPTVRLRLSSGRALLCCHGSPTSFDDIVLPTMPDAEFRRLLAPPANTILTGGHTHLQYVRRLGDALYFNPGSVGLAYDHEQPEDDFHCDTFAEYAILSETDGSFSLEFRRVPFHAAQVRQTYLASGRPHAERIIAQYQPR